MKDNKSFVAYEDFTLGLWGAIAGLTAALVVAIRRLIIGEHEYFWVKVDKKLDKRDKLLRADFSKRMEAIEINIHEIKTSETISNGSLFQIEEILRKLEAKIDNEEK